MKFQKYLFGIALNSKFVAKYTTDSGGVALIVEFNDQPIAGYERMDFISEEQYLDWIDSVVPDDYWYYNEAQGVNLLLQAMRKEDYHA